MPGVLPQVLDCRLHAGVFVEAAKRHAPAPQLAGLPVLVGDDQGGGVEAHATLEQLKSTGSHGDGLLSSSDVHSLRPHIQNSNYTLLVVATAHGDSQLVLIIILNVDSPQVFYTKTNNNKNQTIISINCPGSHGNSLLVLIRCTFSATAHTK